MTQIELILHRFQQNYYWIYLTIRSNLFYSWNPWLIELSGKMGKQFLFFKGECPVINANQGFKSAFTL